MRLLKILIAGALISGTLLPLATAKMEYARFAM